MRNKNGSAVIVLLFIIAILIIIGGSLYYYKRLKSISSQAQVTATSTATPAVAASSSLTTATSSSIVCPTNFSDFAVPQPSCPGAWLTSIQQTSPEVVNIPSSSSIPEEIQGKTAFMQDGEVWVADQDGSNQLQLTYTSGTVSTSAGHGGLFAFSPDFHYLAYYIWGSSMNAKIYASGTIAILDLNNNQVIQQINGLTPSQNGFNLVPGYQTPWVSLDDWVGDDQLVYLLWGLDPPGGGADVYGHFLVDLQKGTTIQETTSQ